MVTETGAMTRKEKTPMAMLPLGPMALNAMDEPHDLTSPRVQCRADAFHAKVYEVKGYKVLALSGEEALEIAVAELLRVR